MATQLGVYRDACRLLGAVRLATVTDDVAVRYQLDDAYDDAVTYVLRQAPWRFALKTAAITQAGAGSFGYDYYYDMPADWLRTHAIFTLDGTREVPIDVREQGEKWYSTYEAFRCRYISTDGETEVNWPEQFATAVAAYLALQVSTRHPGYSDLVEKLQGVYEQALSAAASVDAEPEDAWLPYQLNGKFYWSARYLLQQGFWRFALVVAEPSSTTGPAEGFDYAFTVPSDHVLTHSIKTVDADGKYWPLDAREIGTKWSANVETIVVTYVSDTKIATPVLWPDAFWQVLAAYLGIERAVMQQDERGNATSAWPDLLAKALQEHGVKSDGWLPHQLDGTFLSAVSNLLQKAFWRFALKATTLTQAGATGVFPGYTYIYNFPNDHLRTHSIRSASVDRPIDVREHDGKLSGKATSIALRYLSSDGLDPTGWPEQFERVVAAYLGIEASVAGVDRQGNAVSNWPALLQSAIAELAVPEDAWFPHQMSGEFSHGVDYLLGQGMWKFAMKEVQLSDNVATPAGNYDYAHDKPADHLRTVWLYRIIGLDRRDIDFWEQTDDLHSNVEEPYLRYISTTLGRDETKWTEGFVTALQAYLAWKRAMDTPDTPGAVIQARQDAYRKALNDAQIKDDARERPRVNRTGSWIRARGGLMNREHGY